MAPVETIDAATVDQRCPFKHRTGWRHNIGQSGNTIVQTRSCVSPCAWVKLIFSVSRIKLVIFAQGPCSLLDLRVSSFFAKRPEFVRVILVQAIPPYRSKKKNYPSQILNVILVQGPCSNIQSHTIFVQKPCNSVQRSNSVILAQGPCNSVQRKIRRQARHEVRTSGPALEVSIVSPLMNTMGGLSGGRRGGDVSGAASAPSLVIARLFARALALDLACGIRCPPFVIRKAYASDGSSTPRRKSSAMR